MKASYLVVLVLLAGCLSSPGQPEVSSSLTETSTLSGPVPVLNDWSKGWTLSYLSDRGRWANITVVEEGRIRDWDTYRIEVRKSRATDNDVELSTQWIDKQTLGIVEEYSERMARFGCPIARVFPLQNSTYSCFASYAGQGYGNITLQHHVHNATVVKTAIGTFNETVIEERSDPPFDHANYRAYSSEIGYYTRFREPNFEGGLNEEFRIMSARMTT